MAEACKICGKPVKISKESFGYSKVEGWTHLACWPAPAQLESEIENFQPIILKEEKGEDKD